MSASIYWWPRDGVVPVATLHRYMISGAAIGGVNGPTFTGNILWTSYPGPGPSGTAWLDRWIAPFDGTLKRCVLALAVPLAGVVEQVAFAKSPTPFGPVLPIAPPTVMPATPADTPIIVDAGTGAGFTFLKGEGLSFQLRTWPTGTVTMATLEVEMDVST